MNKKYSELLRDPRWQRKRLEILQRDEWTCQCCFDSESTLHVHHKYYERGRDPWDYDGGALVTLCESCHAEETSLSQAAIRRLVAALCHRGYLSRQFNEVAEAVEKSPNWGPTEPAASVLAHGLTDPLCLAFVDRSFWSSLERKIASRGEDNNV